MGLFVILLPEQNLLKIAGSIEGSRYFMNGYGAGNTYTLYI